MLPALLWVSPVDLAGIRLGIVGWWIPGSSEKTSCPKKSNIRFFLS